MRQKIEKFLDRFPTNATEWRDATDEVRDLSRSSREFLEEVDGIAIEPVNFKEVKNPSEWNTKGRDSILSNFDRMSTRAKDEFYMWFYERFGVYC